VISRTSSFQFKGASADVREIGQRLGVRAVLEGTSESRVSASG
jgi:TolB-like protein